jgi:hypothetical protein
MTAGRRKKRTRTSGEKRAEVIGESLAYWEKKGKERAKKHQGNSAYF